MRLTRRHALILYAVTLVAAVLTMIGQGAARADRGAQHDVGSHASVSAR